MTTMSVACRRTIARLERAEQNLAAPDARRVIRDERMTLIAANQRRADFADIEALRVEAERVLAMWSAWV